MTAELPGCLGRGTESNGYCICICHTKPDLPCDTSSCAPVSAAASDHLHVRHVNRDPDRGKRSSRRGTRSLRHH